MEEGVVKLLQADVIQKLLCGQSVITLSDACKELIENSLDAGATNIEVLVEDYGADCLQVSDNGRGIAAKDFDLICKPSCTSKLNSLEDLAHLNSFGFRGQALCALSMLSNTTVTTRGALEPVGHTLEFDHSGNITRKVACARQVGTTVTCKNCFESFPVRRKQLLRNLKREFSKLVDVTRSYALLPHDVSLSVVNVKNGKRTKEFSANCSISIKENIWEVFGLSFFQTLIEFVQVQPSEDTLSDCKVKDKDFSCIDEIKISGYVSSIHQGRASRDRQFLFLNNRPCDLKTTSKAINEVYRRFNNAQYPAYFVHINMPLGFCDINCAPDKRTILITKENLLEAIVKQSLTSAYEQATVVSSCSQSNAATSHPDSSQSGQPTKSRLEEVSTQKDSTKESSPFILDFGSSNVPPTVRPDADENGQWPTPSGTLYSHGFKSKRKPEPIARAPAETSRATFPSPLLQFERRSTEARPFGGDISSATKRVIPMARSDELSMHKLPKKEVASLEASPVAELEPLRHSTQHMASPSSKSNKVNVHAADGILFRRTVHTVDVDWERVIEKAQRPYEEEGCATSIERTILSESSASSSQVSETTNDVSRILRRSSFAEMDVIGQFNLGFIITRLGDDLFIVDQHASDERYTYEELQKSAVVESQRLVCSIPVEVSAYHREVIMQNLDKFVKNGFGIDLGDDGDTSVTVTAVPTCYGKTFDRQDFDDLVARFAKAPCVLHRPAKLKDIFASKACRKSVMIGTALRCDEMKRILKNLSTTDVPWNCPHGRPTVQHLAKLKHQAAPEMECASSQCSP